MKDSEEDAIQFEFDFPDIEGISAVPYDDRFELRVDTDVLRAEDAGNHTMKVTLLDDQTIFVFSSQVYTFFLVIEYESLPVVRPLTSAATLEVIEVALNLEDVVVTFQLD